MALRKKTRKALSEAQARTRKYGNQPEAARVNEGVELVGLEVTAGLLVEMFSMFPKDAKVVLHNLNEDTMFDGNNITTVSTANLTWNSDVRAERFVVREDDGPVNSVVIDFWHEGRHSLKFTPEQHAEFYARLLKKDPEQAAKYAEMYLVAAAK
jgi:hypothetical protein